MFLTGFEKNLIQSAFREFCHPKNFKLYYKLYYTNFYYTIIDMREVNEGKVFIPVSRYMVQDGTWTLGKNSLFTSSKQAKDL